MSANRIKVTPVYNISSEIVPTFLAFGTDVLTSQSVTLSTAVITRSTDGGNFPIDDIPYFLSNIDTVGLIHEGDDTVFSRIYTWTPDFTTLVYKATFNIAMGLNVSVYTALNFNIGRLRITVRQREPVRVIYDQILASGAANQAATGLSYHIFNADISEPFYALAGRPIDITIELTSTAGTGTRQEGILPVFPFQAAAVTKMFSLSGVVFYGHAGIDYGDPVFKDNLGRIKST